MNTLTTETLYNNLREQLKQFINSKVKNKDLTEDILHDTFRKVHENIDKLTDKEKVVSWIYQIARNAVNDYFRKKKNISGGAEVEDIIDTSVSDKITRSLQASLKSMIDCMPPEYREPLMMTEYQGLTQKELAVELGISLPGAKSRVQRARKKLKQMLFDCCHFEFDKYGSVIDYYQKSNSCTCCSS